MRRLKTLIYTWIGERYMHGCSNYNSLAVRKGCRSKAQGRAIFSKNNVPHAHGLIFFAPGGRINLPNNTAFHWWSNPMSAATAKNQSIGIDWNILDAGSFGFVQCLCAGNEPLGFAGFGDNLWRL